MTDDGRVLLQNQFTPTHYDLEIEPDFERFSFDGIVKISTTITKETSLVTLHAKELSFWKADFQPKLGAKIPASNINFDLDATTVALV